MPFKIKAPSKAALSLLSKLDAYTHTVSYAVCANPNAKMGHEDIEFMTKKDIAKQVGLSLGHIRTLLNELCTAGLIAYVYLGEFTRIFVNPIEHPVSVTEPSKFTKSMFLANFAAAKRESINS
ncbi:winged helix-turn-helix domain-containing protein [Paenibacillus sp. FSL E2-0274]|uniref:winged helix-turn-helix domain-containing protein n=1 Tax=Paenibacillus TaxID=44249 RepID=UPI00096D1FBB|nr:winged helix-turn-helix domain-containing protein [Paenibacillus odorifer]OME31786.1 hypothetical protein BSK63_14640 [Paenibacillus odorifer]OME37894.1 hypothetical protein BSK46_14295 [Paenibacillus odorifer]